MSRFAFTITGCFLFILATAQSLTDFIVVDQFGYLPDAPKIAVIRDPITGYDAALSFSPGSTYALVNATTKETIFSGPPVIWNNGNTDASSGDKAWWFDFSHVTQTGKYFIVDVDKNVRSFEFNISPSVYNHVLKQAVRTMFYQRAGYAKQAPFAEKAWVDGASHIGNLQDKNCRIFNDKFNAATERDVSGGWYDAGDYNKYTNWTAHYIIDMMISYLENPLIWKDDYNLPESGNGIPDIVDEAKWGLDHLIRMQLENGSVLSIVGMSHASPPSAATGQSLYGSVNTSATLNTSAAFAIASKVFQLTGNTVYATLLKEKAIKAWDWAVANPSVLFRNNDAAYGSSGLGAGQQETDDYGRLMAKLKAACFLFEITGDTKYRTFFESNYTQAHLIAWSFAFPFESDVQDILLYYTTLSNTTPSVVTQIKNVYRTAMLNGTENLPAFTSKKDPYRAHIKDYTWGSNSIKCRQGSMFFNIIKYNIDSPSETNARNAALAIINYIHGVNPLNFVYLSNMYKYGAKKGVNEFYHTWFTNGSAKWDRVGTSTYGPAPGFVTGGPNPSYNWDGCCPSSCGSGNNNAICISEVISPPKNQPNQKSYKDFNTSWPLNSWEVTENSNGYQLSYIRLLSKFINPDYDCNGDLNGTAYIDACGKCAGGNTGITPENNPDLCGPNPVNKLVAPEPFIISPNPTGGSIKVTNLYESEFHLQIRDLHGKLHYEKLLAGNPAIDISFLSAGFYILFIKNSGTQYSQVLVKTP